MTVAPRQRRARRLAALWLAVLGPAALVPCALPGAAAADAGSGSARPAPPGSFPPVAPGTYAPPVPRPVRDPFRLDAGPYGPGNRGLEYATRDGDLVRAIGAGRVAFAGPVAGRLALSVVHPDGRRSTLTGLRSLLVSVGELVARGTPVGRAGTGLHLGLLEGRRYVDPAPFVGAARRRAVLVPLGR